MRFAEMENLAVCLSILRFSSFPAFQTMSSFVERRSFLATQGRFFASRIFTWYHYRSRNQSGCGNLKL